jgi:hypothetical protein
MHKFIDIRLWQKKHAKKRKTGKVWQTMQTKQDGKLVFVIFTC